MENRLVKSISKNWPTLWALLEPAKSRRKGIEANDYGEELPRRSWARVSNERTTNKLEYSEDLNRDFKIKVFCDGR